LDTTPLQPLVPAIPLLGAIPSHHKVAPEVPSVLGIRHTRMTISGRYALALALQHAGIKAGDEVLVPAYHCTAMLAPIVWLQATPKFYAIQADTAINWDSLQRQVTTQTKAIIATHFFGLVHNLTVLRQWCDQRGIILIEDCAHAFFGSSGQQAVGGWGHYSIASSMKFLPLYEGGVLASNSIDLAAIRLESAGLGFQLKSLCNIIEKSVAYNRLGYIGKGLQQTLRLKDAAWSTLKRYNATTTLSQGPASSEGGYGLDIAWLNKTCSWSSKWLLQTANFSHIAEQRRHNYQYLQQALSGLPHCRPLLDGLPAYMVPWVYPLYVEYPDRYFTVLKQRGVPLWRFGEQLSPVVDKNLCPISVDYSRHIFQLPCHQSLTMNELAWMASQVVSIFKES
jgi:perosamine synthetase